MPENTHATAESHEYDRFLELAVENADYDRVDEFLTDRVAFTPREWAIARLCSDFRTGTGVEMTRIGENLPDLVPFMSEPYSRQAVYGARRSFEEKVRIGGATFLYGAYSEFFTADELADLMYESVETAKFLLEVEGADVSLEDELTAEERVREAMQEVREASAELRYDRCPHCGEGLGRGAGGTAVAEDGEGPVDADAGEDPEAPEDGETAG
jgi:hypothetical protein